MLSFTPVSASAAPNHAPTSSIVAPTRIADAWFAHNAVLLMLGASDHIVLTVARPQTFPWMYRVAPGFNQALSIDGSTLNAEELLRLHTQLVFATPSVPVIGALKRAGLRVVPVDFDDFNSMLQCIDLTADALKTPQAQAQAAAYAAYLHATLAQVSASLTTPKPHSGLVSHTEMTSTSKVPKSYAHTELESMQAAVVDSTANGSDALLRPTVLHIASLRPLKVDGADTIVEQWIKAAGGRNAAVGLNGNLKTVSIEQVLAWHPDVIILAANAGNIDQSSDAALWNTLDAVREHRVYRNPAGVFPWDRYGPEVALQVRWAAGVLHPEQFSTVQAGSMLQQTQAFYKQFFNYVLSRDDARRMLAGLPPGAPLPQS
jgi:iron complex transport system substrate-binding protein